MTEKRRATYLSVVEYHNLEHACRLFIAAFGFNLYLVGSVLERPDYRDVDIRCILDDEEFDAFAGKFWSVRHRLLNTSLSEWLAARSGLNIDFQFQRRTEANEQNKDRPRHFIGHPMPNLMACEREHVAL